MKQSHSKWLNLLLSGDGQNWPGFLDGVRVPPKGRIAPGFSKGGSAFEAHGATSWTSAMIFGELEMAGVIKRTSSTPLLQLVAPSIPLLYVNFS
jgi:hypothetical protein